MLARCLIQIISPTKQARAMRQGSPPVSQKSQTATGMRAAAASDPAETKPVQRTTTRKSASAATTAQGAR